MRSFVSLTFAVVVLYFPTGSLLADVVIVNGSLTGPNDMFSLIPPGWSTLFPLDPQSTPDTEGEGGPHETYNLSPDGGTFVAGAHATLQNPTGIEGIQQTVSGLNREPNIA